MLTEKSKTRLFVDGEDPCETMEELLRQMGDSSTGESLTAKSSEISDLLATGRRRSREEEDNMYKNVVHFISLPYRSLNGNNPWDLFVIAHELTTRGIWRFVKGHRNMGKKLQ